MMPVSPVVPVSPVCLSVHYSYVFRPRAEGIVKQIRELAIPGLPGLPPGRVDPRSTTGAPYGVE